MSSGGERGLLSVALAPDYPSTHHLYVFYTRSPDGALQIDEFTADGGSVAVSTRRPVLTIPHPTFFNHNGGQLQFGPDGMLYIGTGDGGSGDDPSGNAQNLESLLGKILRIDPRASGSAPYTIPADNPFAGSPIWSYGLRNPWRFSFDRQTGDLLIGDVGQGEREEVDYAPAPAAGRAANYGWDCLEGTLPGGEPEPSCDGASGFVAPIFEYDHEGGRCAITGGYVVRDQSLGDLFGRYLFADSCAGPIRSLVPGLPIASGARAEGLSVSGPSSFGEDSCGRVYVASLGTGEVSRFVGDAPASCATDGGAAPAPRCAGEPATRVAGEGRAIGGSPGDDVIVADGRKNRIKSGGGDDTICALGGGDSIRAGRGADRIRGGHGNDNCIGGRGKDRVRSC